MSAEYNLCPKCGGVKPTRIIWRPASKVDLTLVPAVDTGSFSLCSCGTWSYSIRYPGAVKFTANHQYGGTSTHE